MSSKSTEGVPDALDHTVCALYTPGHRVHFIQAKLGWEEDPANHRTGTILSVEDDGWINVDVDGEVLRLWNHEPERARRCLEESGGRVVLPGHCLLRAPGEEGNYCFSVSTNGPTPCAGPPPAGTDPAERIRSHGGFLLSGPDIRRILQEARDKNGRKGT
jgi:hypothetical protein